MFKWRKERVKVIDFFFVILLYKEQNGLSVELYLRWIKWGWREVEILEKK